MRAGAGSHTTPRPSRPIRQHAPSNVNGDEGQGRFVIVTTWFILSRGCLRAKPLNSLILPRPPPSLKSHVLGGGSDPPSLKSHVLGGGSDPPSCKTHLLGGGWQAEGHRANHVQGNVQSRLAQARRVLTEE